MHTSIIIFVTLRMFLQMVSSLDTGKESEEALLLTKLLTNYKTLARPVRDRSVPTPVELGLTFLRLVEVKEKQQVLETNVWLTLRWVDNLLTWEPEEYGNISEIRLPSHQVWVPDIELYNAAEGKSLREQWSDFPIIVYHNGSALLVPTVLLKSTCRMEVKWFPFDEQNCTIQMGSWTYSEKEINLTLNRDKDEDNGNTFMENGEWQMISIEVGRHVKMYDCCPDPYISVEYYLHIKRRTFYHFFNLIVPCALIGFLALLGFTVPPDSHEKLTLGVTVLFSLIVFLNMISGSMPANSDSVPLLGTYFNCVMLTIAMSVMSTVVINLRKRSIMDRDKRIRGLKRTLFLTLVPRILCMKVPVFEKKNTGNKGENKCAISSKILMEDGGSERTTAIADKEWLFVALVIDRICLYFSLIFSGVAFTLMVVKGTPPQ